MLLIVAGIVAFGLAVLAVDWLLRNDVEYFTLDDLDREARR